MASDPYSRLVVFLKVALPLVALGILSTLFLLSSRIEPGTSIPFAEGEVEKRIRSEQVTGPLFSGVTTGGDRVTFTADQIVTTEGNTNTALNPVAHLEFATGGSVELVAEQGDVDLANDFMTMSGDVVIDSTTGYSHADRHADLAPVPSRDLGAGRRAGERTRRDLGRRHDAHHRKDRRRWRAIVFHKRCETGI